MAKVVYSEAHKKVIDSFLLEVPGVVAGKMFGYPAYYVEGKLFACLYEGGIGIKVPETMANELIGTKGITHFVPLGRKKMRQWIQIDREMSEDYRKDQAIFEESVRFVAEDARKGKK